MLNAGNVTTEWLCWLTANTYCIYHHIYHSVSSFYHILDFCITVIWRNMKGCKIFILIISLILTLIIFATWDVETLKNKNLLTMLKLHKTQTSSVFTLGIVHIQQKCHSVAYYMKKMCVYWWFEMLKFQNQKCPIPTLFCLIDIWAQFPLICIYMYFISSI